MNLKLTLLLSFLICAFTINAQRNCGSMDHQHHLHQTDPSLKNRMDAIEKATQKFINNPQKAVTGTITIPVVVHVVYRNAAQNISTAQINSQIDILNEDFRRLNSDANGTWPQAADTEIEFCMASIDPSGNPTTGITRTSTTVVAHGTDDSVKFDAQGGKSAWPAADYMNIWVCNIGGGVLGYAQFPGGPANTDGVVCGYQYWGTQGTAPFNLGRTMTHEVGHYLNLYHIWGDGGCGVDDMVSDTPASDDANYGCTPNHSSCGTIDMVQNYMDYSDDACMNLYTEGQKDRMRALFDTGGFRESLLTSTACGSGGTPPTCSDGIQNGDETGIDCGGTSCPSCSTTCTDNEVLMSITFDDYASETSWTLTDASGSTLYSGGSYKNQASGSTITESFCLVDGCFDFNIFDSYGDGICCAYGNGSYSVTDSNGNILVSGGTFGSSETTNFCANGGGGGGSTCTDEDINFNNFESNWGIWNDGGADCARVSDSQRSIGNKSIRLRDNTGTSKMTTDNLSLLNFEELTVDFSYFAFSMENGEDFWLQISTNGGSTFQTIKTYARGTDFQNNVREYESVNIAGPFTNSTKIRFKCDASADNDWIFIDNVDISGCNSSTTRLIGPEDTSDDLIEEENISIQSIKSFPNPTNGEFNLEINSTIENEIQMSIVDPQGRLIAKDLIQTDKGLSKVLLDLSSYEPGLYLVHLNSGTQRFVEKVFVVR